VAWDGAAAIADPVNAPAQATVPRTPGAATGSHDIPAPGPLFVKVAAVIRDHGTAYATSGTPVRAPRQEIPLRYEIKPGLGRRARLLLTADHLDQLPALTLRGRTDNRPAGPADPPILTIAAGTAQPDTPITLADKQGRRLHPRSCRLYPADNGDNANGPAIRIIDPT
jgi:hypothetical protein